MLRTGIGRGLILAARGQQGCAHHLGECLLWGHTPAQESQGAGGSGELAWGLLLPGLPLTQRGCSTIPHAQVQPLPSQITQNTQGVTSPSAQQQVGKLGDHTARIPDLEGGSGWGSTPLP